jgi:hypothetical protein
MSAAVYLLCTATSFACAVLLLRGYWRNRIRLLLWSGLCFVCLTVDNVALFLDLVVFPDVELAVSGISLSVLRKFISLTGLVLLLYGLIWDAR